MRFTLCLAFLVACGSETKVDDNLDPPRQTGSDPTGGTTPVDTDEPTNPGTDGDADTDADADADTDTDVDTGEPSTVPVDPPTDITEQELCEQAAALTITLDPYQTPGDGRVYYCHSGSGNSYNYIETDISSCLPHLNHTNDIFPTSGCDS